MADFTESEIFNEVSKIFLAQLTPTRTGGVLATDQEYKQLLNLASTTFLLNPKAIFYLGRRVANVLNQNVIQEVALIEDMLVGLDDLVQIGEPFRDTTTISNASTALLSLDAASVVTGRPEVQRFSNLMDDVAAGIRPNVVAKDGQLVRPREESRTVIRTDFERLEEIHAKVVAATFALRDLIDTYLELNIPGKVATTALTNIRSIMDELETTAADTPDAENIALSRQTLLSALTSKVAVNVIDKFTNPTEIKYRSPNNPVPADLKHTGRVVTCEPGFVLSGKAPWDLPIVDPIQISVDGGPTQLVDLSVLSGPMLQSDNIEDFEIPANTHLHVVVNSDASVRPATGFTAANIDVTQTGFKPLRFKDVGSTLVISGGWPAMSTTDSYPRVIAGLAQLQNFSGLSWYPTYTYNGKNYVSVVVLGTATGISEPGSGLASKHVGDYLATILGGTKYYEVLEVLYGSASASIVVIDARDQTPPTGPAVASLLLGSSDLGTVRVTVTPYYSGSPPAGLTVSISPSVKTVSLTSGTRTASQIVQDVEAETGVFGASPFARALNWHVKALSILKRVALVPRTRKDPYLRITDSFGLVNNVTPGVEVRYAGSAGPNIGYPTGRTLPTRFDANDALSAEDLVTLINASVVGVEATVTSEEVFSAKTLSTVAGTKIVRDTTIGFITAGVSSGSLVEIAGGAESGVYRVAVASNTELTLVKQTVFTANESDLIYKVLEEHVKIASKSTSRGTSVEIVSAPTDLGFPVGVQYGTSVEFEAVTKQGAKLSFDQAEDDDVLKLPGRDPIGIESVDGELLTLESPLPSNVVNTPFTIRSNMGEQYDALKSSLVTYTTSANLLRKHGFDKNLDKIDYVLTAALLPGQNFISSRNTAKQILGDLLALMTDEPERVDEHGVDPAPATLNLTDILVGYLPAAVDALDDLIAAFLDRKYNRAVDLMLGGDLNGFYNSDSETGSYSGAVLSAARTALRDLPPKASDQQSVDAEVNIATGSFEETDADYDFSDTEGF